MLRQLFIPFTLGLLMLQAQPAGKFALTVDNIMRGPSLYGYEPSEVRWSGDGERIYFQWKQAADPENADPDTYVVNREGAGLRKLTEAEAKLAPPANGVPTRDHRRSLYTRDGDIFLYDAIGGQTRQITKTGDVESNPHFTRDEKRIYFTRSNNLYVMGLDTGLLEQLTDIRSAATAGPAAPTPPAGGRGQGGGRAGAAAAASSTDPPKGTDSQEFLKKEERDLLESVRARAAKRERDEARRKAENPRKPFTLGARQTVGTLQLSPDEKYVTATIIEAGDRSKTSVVPNFVTESSYIEDILSRGLVGDVQSRARVAILAVDTGEQKWVDTAQKPATGSPEREVALGQPAWSEDGTKAILAARSADFKDRWILALDPATGKTRILDTEHDAAWIGGPGVNVLGWMKDNATIYFESERTGYAQLYSVPFEGGEPKALTSGKFEISAITLSKDKSKFYFVSNEADPGEKHFYEMSIDGGPRTRLTKAPGGHAGVLSPDERFIADIYSYTNKPPELYVQAKRSEAPAARLTTSPAPEFNTYAWQDAPIVTFPARDGAQVRARLYKPANFRPNGPAVIFVHGAGYLQNVHKWWSSYSHEYLFQHVLMDKGFLVIDVDYRGSAGYGRDWRTGIYRHMGGKDLDDEVDAAKWIVAQHGVDPKRIGMYGGSYGGFMTLMAMFTQPDVIAAGAALRPVTDWAHYNHQYTSAILNNPQTDSDAYRQSSPIYFAKGLKGRLLICHGMVDTNVFFQDTVRLVQKLIELHKENWELAVFPVENHGFVEPASWTDEYKRILNLFERTLK